MTLHDMTSDQLITHPPVPLGDDRLYSEHHARDHLEWDVVEAVVDVRGAVKKAPNTWIIRE